MIWAGEVQYRIVQYDQDLFIFTNKHASERMILSFDDNTFSSPLPELSLSGPKLTGVSADDERGMFLFFLLSLFVTYICHGSNLSRELGTPVRVSIPWGKP